MKAAMIEDILTIGVRDGLVWFPLVLGLGLLYAKFREIDVSVDGVTITAGLVAGAVWNATSSYALSIGAAIVVGAVLAGFVSFAAWKLQVGFLMAGIVFTIGAQAASVLFVGESLALQRSLLMPGFQELPLWLLGLAFALAVALEALLRTNLGLDLRLVGAGIELNPRRDPFRLRCLACVLAGSGYGLTAALLVHSEGVARSGSGFDHLLVGLCSYLCAARLIEMLRRGVVRITGMNDRSELVVARGWHRALIDCWRWTSLRALTGSVLFQIVVFTLIVKTPNPSAWKLVMALVLLVALAHWSPRSTRAASPNNTKTTNDAGKSICSVSNLSFAYDTGTELRPVFKCAAAEFATGLNLVKGDNGAGKSTLLKILSGQLRPTAGTIIQPQQPAAYFLVPQRLDEALSPDLTVCEALAAAVPLNGNSPFFPSVSFAADRLRSSFARDELLQILDRSSSAAGGPLFFSPEDPLWLKPCGDLSGGQALMTLLFCAYLSERPVVLLDEPTTGLAVDNVDRLLLLLQGLARRRIVIVTSHDHRLDALQPRTFRLNGGTIEAS